MAFTIWRQQYPYTFTTAPESWDQRSGSAFPFSGLPSGYSPDWLLGECVQIPAAGTLKVTDIIDHHGVLTGSPHLFAGAAFYGIGYNDPLKERITDDNTYAWDQRGVVADALYKFDTSWLTDVGERGGYYPLIVLAKSVFSSTIGAAVNVYGAGNGAESLKLEIYRNRWPQITYPGSGYIIPGAAITPDNRWHTIRFRAEPGTVTVGSGLNNLNGYSVASNGYWRVWIDGVMVAEEVNIPLYMGYSSNAGFLGNPVMLRSAWMGYNGMPGDGQDLHLYRLSAGEEPPDITSPETPTAKECCGDTSTPTEPSTTTVETPVSPYVEPPLLEILCTGDGEVPQGGQGVDGDDDWM